MQIANPASTTPSPNVPTPCDRLIRMPEVEKQTGLKKSAIYTKLANKTFPRPVRLSTRYVAWSQAAVQAWIQERIAESSELEGMQS